MLLPPNINEFDPCIVLTFEQLCTKMYTMNTLKETTEPAYAKINLGLDVVGSRSDGYHLLKMVMQTLSLHDTVTVRVVEGGSGIRTVTDSDLVPDDSHNLAFRAAGLLAEKYHIDKGIEIEIKKRIPVAAGLAGGSSDAAAVLRAVNRLFDLRLDNAGLRETGLSLGADVPYCIEGGTRLSEGIGEILTPVVPELKGLSVLLIKPDSGVSTKEVYEAFDALDTVEHPDTDGIIKAIKAEDIPALGKLLGNVLEAVTVRKLPEISRIKDFLRQKGTMGVLMSGSGPTVFAIDSKRELLENTFSEAKELFPGYEVILTETR